MQALCCLSGTLVVRPGDEPPREFRVRPDENLDKGTGAQHRQVLKPLRVPTAPKGVLITGFYSIISLTPKATVTPSATTDKHQLAAHS
ncbi:MAG TPA: hypothetical protein DD803_13770 [Alcaligenes faecalis]|nr:hypothetical protein [Alcaligenes faecalis]